MNKMALFTIKKTIDYLESLWWSTSQLPLEDIDEFFLNARLQKKDFVSHCVFSEDNYTRTLLSKNKNYELMIVGWLPHQVTAIHDHGGQHCWMKILHGELHIHNFLPISDKQNQVPVNSGPVKVYKNGQTVYLDDKIGVHSVANDSDRPTISVHLYSRPISKYNTYNEVTQKFEMKRMDTYEAEVKIPASEKPKRPRRVEPT